MRIEVHRNKVGLAINLLNNRVNQDLINLEWNWNRFHRKSKEMFNSNKWKIYRRTYKYLRN